MSAAAISRDPQNLCPECHQGKHLNCSEQTLDANDEWVPCDCGHPRLW